MLRLRNLLQPPVSRKGLKQFKLAAVTKPLDTSQVEKMALEAIKRILAAESVLFLFLGIEGWGGK